MMRVAPFAARSRREGGALSRFLVRLASRAVNAVRLAGLASHRRRVAQSRRVLRAVRSFEGEAVAGRCFSYLRQVEPAVFEEVVLSALEDAGLFVLRNRRYTGDGVVDGQVRIAGRGWCAIQIKRYGRHIKARHVVEFGRVVQSQGYAGGLFVHTGRSGAALYPNLALGGTILVSGDGLLELVLERRLPGLMDRIWWGAGA